MLPLASSPATVVAQYGPRIEQYVEDRFQIHSRDGRPYQLHVESLSMKATNDARWTSNNWFVVQGKLQAPSGVSTEVFALDYNVILQRVVSHQALIYVRRDIRNGLVEVLIAVSILVSCAHAWRPLFAGREVWIASAFGLVHGLAFAEVLAGLDFDTTTLMLSLIGFNLGIAAMQLLVIAATLPLMLLLSTTRRYASVRVVSAALTATCAVGWVLERAFGLTNPLQPVADWMAPPPLWFALSVSLASGVALCILLLESRSRSRVSLSHGWRAPFAQTHRARWRGPGSWPIRNGR